MTRQPTPGVHENFADKRSSPAPESHVRASILEEAAKIADEEAAMWGHTDGSSARVVAQRIRALASEGQADA